MVRTCELSLSVLVGCYGCYPHYSLRAVRSTLEFPSTSIHVGCNACGAETLTALRGMYDSGEIATLIESRDNLNKDPMMRLLIDRSSTDYVLWMDDDTYLEPGWSMAVAAFFEKYAPFDVAGHVFFCHRSEEYKAFLRERPWWRGMDAYPNDDWRARVWFATGGVFLARTVFLRKHRFPDRGMVKRQDDLLLGDLIGQQGGKLVDFAKHDLMRFVRMDGAEQRGSGEGADGWKFGVC